MYNSKGFLGSLIELESLNLFYVHLKYRCVRMMCYLFNTRRIDCLSETEIEITAQSLQHQNHVSSIYVLHFNTRRINIMHYIFIVNTVIIKKKSAASFLCFHS